MAISKYCMSLIDDSHYTEYNIIILARSKRLENISKQIVATKSTDELSRKLEVNCSMVYY